MNEKLSAAKAFLKRVWDKVVYFLKLAWAFIVKTYKLVAPKVVSGAKFVFDKTVSFFKTVVKDKQKLILAIILTVAILFSCIAVVRAVKGIASGIAGIFASDNADDEDNAKDEEKQTAETNSAAAENDCEHCINGVCIHCENGFIDCPDCEKGVCIKCNGTGENTSKFAGLFLDNCTACKGTKVCNDCNEDYMIDCKYCDGGKCTECQEETKE